MAKNSKSVDSANNQDVSIKRILAPYKGSKDKSRPILFVLSDGNVIEFCWEKDGRVTELSYSVYKEDRSMSEKFMQNNECYELIYEKGKIKEVRIPELLKTMKSSLSKSSAAPTEVKKTTKRRKK